MVFHETIFPSIPNIAHTPFISPNFSPPIDAISPNTSSNNQNTTHLRRSERFRATPPYFQDYYCTNMAKTTLATPVAIICSTLFSGKPYPITYFLYIIQLSPTHIAFVFTITSDFDSKNFKQAAPHPHWQATLEAQIKALKMNKT